MKGYRINPDMDYVMKIITGLQKKDGHCPCKIGQAEENLCPCDEFVSTGVCHCKLFLPKENK